ncbi:MAG TPA: peroxiredoxin-like family protein [Terriglobales bacterium]|jgi:peroxiredoxin|nr:peroxiredoxin-like family protein [Terriglobales bacterium]
MKWRSLDESAPSSDRRSLREIFAERKELGRKYVPEDIRAIHARVVAELQQQGFVPQPVGSQAPAFELKDHNGKLVSSIELLSRGPLIIFFLRGRWCPFCVGQLEAMTLVAEDIKLAGASVVAISPQNVHQSFLMHDQHKPRFPLLSDGGNHVARQFGLVYKVPDYQQAIYKSAFVNLPFANGDASWELAIPATFVVNRDGSIVYGSANADYTDRPEPAEILQVVTSFSDQASQEPPVR